MINTSKLYSFYLAVVSFISIIAVAITIWIVITSIWKYFLISDEEYLQYRESYKLTGCRNSIYNPIYDEKGIIIKNEETKKTPESIKECEDKVRKEVSASRWYDLKDTFISSFSWFVVFLILFLFHYPKFLKTRWDN